MRQILQMKKVMRTALLVLLLIAAGMGKSLSQTFTSGNLKYEVNDDGISVTLTGHVDGNAASGELNIPERVSYQNETYAVTRIAGYAFYRCRELTGTLVIPNLVTSIGEAAFQSCYKLTSLNLPESILSIDGYAFEGCGITSIVIPQAVTSIGAYAFGYCSGLTTVYYNAESAIASNYAFYRCTNLTTLYIGPNVQSIGSVFGGCSGVHLVVALGNTPASLSGYGFSNIADNSILMVPCGCRMAYYSVWNAFEFNNIMEDCNTYTVSMNGVGSGGSVSASSTNAQMGEAVDLIATPNAGMVLASLEVVNTSDPSQTIPVMPAGKATSNYRFVMPPFGVSVLASFVVGTSVDENEMIDASVYPNPTSGQVRIEAEGLKHIGISNMIGQQILEGEANGDVFEYDFGKHDAGVYLVRIETTNGIAVKKVLVMR